MSYKADLLQDGIVVASVIAPTKKDAMREINHYAAQYVQDGPVMIGIKNIGKIRAEPARPKRAKSVLKIG